MQAGHIAQKGGIYEKVCVDDEAVVVVVFPVETVLLVECPGHNVAVIDIIVSALPIYLLVQNIDQKSRIVAKPKLWPVGGHDSFLVWECHPPDAL